MTFREARNTPSGSALSLCRTILLARSRASLGNQIRTYLNQANTSSPSLLRNRIRSQIQSNRVRQPALPAPPGSPSLSPAVLRARLLKTNHNLCRTITQSILQSWRNRCGVAPSAISTQEKVQKPDAPTMVAKRNMRRHAPALRERRSRSGKCTFRALSLRFSLRRARLRQQLPSGSLPSSSPICSSRRRHPNARLSLITPCSYAYFQW
jgi:hypothetical protein